MRDGSSPRRILVLDFDGTVAVGDDPVRAYRDAVLERVPAGAASDRLDAYLAGEPLEDPPANEYALVAAWADSLGVAAEARAAAYAASRDALHAGTIGVTAPDGLAAALARRSGDVRAVLVTNAPVDGIAAVLERLGLAFDELVGDAGKPDGMTAVLRRLLAEADLPADRLLSVGDLWANDLAPAAALGAATAHVDRFGRREGTPTFRARTLTELLPDIERWWSA